MEDETKEGIPKDTPEIKEEQELFEIYDKLFSSKPNEYSLEASAVYQMLQKKYKKEEIRTVAEILIALAKAPSFLDLVYSS